MSRIRESFDCAAIKHIVHEFYREKKYPTIAGVLEKAKMHIGFKGRVVLYEKGFGELGFHYKKRDRRQYILEQPHITARHFYLQNIICQLRKEYNIIYTDETWVNTHHTENYIWIDEDGKGGWRVPSGKGTRLIIVHAGGVEGWVEGAGLALSFKNKLCRLP